MAQESSTKDNKRNKRNVSESKSKIRERAGKCSCIKSGALRVLVPGIADASTQLEAVAVGVV